MTEKTIAATHQPGNTMNAHATINLPFEIIHNSDGFTYCSDDNLHLSVYATSINNAKSKLRPAIEEKIQEMLKADNNCERRVMGCHSGQVLIVSYRHGSWGYDIAGEGRNHCASCCGFQSFDQACEKAKDHAAQVWGGIKWEC